MLDWTALGVGSSDREGRTDNAADKTLIIIYSTAYDGQINGGKEKSWPCEKIKCLRPYDKV